VFWASFVTHDAKEVSRSQDSNEGCAADNLERELVLIRPIQNNASCHGSKGAYQHDKHSY
jgi:hypothetical protein